MCVWSRSRHMCLFLFVCCQDLHIYVVCVCVVKIYTYVLCVCIVKVYTYVFCVCIWSRSMHMCFFVCVCCQDLHICVVWSECEHMHTCVQV